jgi:hypothetical protein
MFNSVHLEQSTLIWDDFFGFPDIMYGEWDLHKCDSPDHSTCIVSKLDVSCSLVTNVHITKLWPMFALWWYDLYNRCFQQTVEKMSAKEDTSEICELLRYHHFLVETQVERLKLLKVNISYVT